MKMIFDEKGNLIETIEDSQEIEEIIDIENDPYWQAPIPVDERKHRKDKRQKNKREMILKGVLVGICVILLLVFLYNFIIIFI